ncbi:hypothetical protein [Tsukamurella ocularis]|uniref:hypothetical protein n=1 Tax=Tsukamurella ocularis TaxID=1970234 RepID=UPI002169253B|nr:hypothetical protein [Tsukamurella ocularis]MCS3853294.1 hypothetical protein [Tsukamurella ocularis]
MTRNEAIAASELSAARSRSADAISHIRQFRDSYVNQYLVKGALMETAGSHREIAALLGMSKRDVSAAANSRVEDRDPDTAPSLRALEDAYLETVFGTIAAADAARDMALSYDRGWAELAQTMSQVDILDVIAASKGWEPRPGVRCIDPLCRTWVEEAGSSCPSCGAAT